MSSTTRLESRLTESSLAPMAKAYNIGLIVMTVCSAFVALTFMFGKTAYVGAFWLVDPSAEDQHQVGRILGAVISGILAVSLAWLVAIFKSSVLQELPGLEQMRSNWSTITKRIKSGVLVPTPPNVFQELTMDYLPGRRLKGVLESWDDASPDSDAEYVIEGAAASVRQQLGVVQTIASILVLIGLVGNFFGLSDAVQKFPSLVVTPQETVTAAAPSKSVTMDFEEVTGSKKNTTKSKVYDVTQRTETSVAPPPVSLQSTENAMREIAASLQVVVISSVMGIGAMAVLLLFVAVFKAILSSLLAQEVVLMSAEIGSLIRPGNGLGLSEKLEHALETLPEKLMNFDVAAAGVTKSLGAYSTDFSKISGSLDSLLQNQLKDAQHAYVSYQQSLTKFTGVMEDERATVVQLVDATSRLCDGLDGIAKSVKGVATYSEDVNLRLANLQSHYESYLQSAQQELKNHRDSLANTHKMLSDGEASRTAAQAKAIADTAMQISTTTKDSLETLFTEMRRDVTESLEQRSAKEIAALSEVEEAQKELVRVALEGLAQNVSSNEYALKAGAEAVERAKAAIDESQNRFVEMQDLLVHQNDVAMSTMAADWRTQLSEHSERSMVHVSQTTLQLAEKLKDVPALLKELGGVSEVLSHFSDRLREFQAAKAEAAASSEKKAESEERFRSELLTKLDEHLQPLTAAAGLGAEQTALTRQSLELLMERMDRTEAALGQLAASHLASASDQKIDDSSDLALTSITNEEPVL